MEQRNYPNLNEQIFWDKLPNGLQIAVVPRPGFSKKLAYFVTDFGAIDLSFTLNGEEVTLPEGFVRIPMDPVLIEQVLMNLLENAVFHAEGMEHLWLKVELQNNLAWFSVEDDGCGIPQDRMQHLFTGLLDSGATVDSTRNNMGIGLSVCRTIIKAHGSELKAENRPQGGAVFSFALEMEENEYVEQ